MYSDTTGQVVLNQPDLSYPNTCTLADTVYVYRASNFVFEKDPHPLDVFGYDRSGCLELLMIPVDTV
jgi:hypothetical protein